MRSKTMLRLGAVTLLSVSLIAPLAACSGEGGQARTAASGSPAASPSEASASEAPASEPASAEPTTEPVPEATLPPGSTGVADGLQRAPESAPVPTLPPVALADESVSDEGLTVKVVSFRDVETPAGAPGEIGGPGVAFDITVINNGGTRIDISNVVADLRSGPDLTPVLRADRAPTVPFTGTLAPGATASATYAFTLPEADRSNVTLYLILTADTPTAVFTGSVQ